MGFFDATFINENCQKFVTFGIFYEINFYDLPTRLN